jgi:hypothetical protein
MLLLFHYYHYITLPAAPAACNDNGETTAAASDSVM